MARRVKTLKELQAEWRDKLKRAGFEDIETKNGDLINTSHSGGVLDKRRVTWQSQEEYYYLARMFLNDHKFESKREQNIWMYHTEGLSARNIARTLTRLNKKNPIIYITVWRIIIKLEAAMKSLYGVRHE